MIRPILTCGVRDLARETISHHHQQRAEGGNGRCTGGRPADDSVLEVLDAGCAQCQSQRERERLTATIAMVAGKG